MRRWDRFGIIANRDGDISGKRQPPPHVLNCNNIPESTLRRLCIAAIDGSKRSRLSPVLVAWLRRRQYGSRFGFGLINQEQREFYAVLVRFEHFSIDSADNPFARFDVVDILDFRHVRSHNIGGTSPQPLLCVQVGFTSLPAIACKVVRM